MLCCGLPSVAKESVWAGERTFQVKAITAAQIRGAGRHSPGTRMSTFTSRPRIRPGSTRSRSGFSKLQRGVIDHGIFYFGCRPTLVAEEGTRTLMPALREVIQQQVIFCALYSDRASHFFVRPKAGGKVDESQVTPLPGAVAPLHPPACFRRARWDRVDSQIFQSPSKLPVRLRSWDCTRS
jgi:hypothetical protein